MIDHHRVDVMKQIKLETSILTDLILIQFLINDRIQEAPQNIMLSEKYINSAIIGQFHHHVHVLINLPPS